MPPTVSPSRRTLAVVLLALLGILGVLVGGLTWWLRERLRTEVLQREAEAIHAVALMEVDAAQSRSPAAGEIDPDSSLFTAVLESSRLRGVMAVQLFDATGSLRVALPAVVAEAQRIPWWPASLVRPVARYEPRGSLEAVFGAKLEPGEEPTRVPLLEIVVPLRAKLKSAETLGTARYWVDGGPVAGELARMDRGLFWQALLAFAGGATLVALVLAWAWARLATAHRRLAEQGADLARANQELDFAAKTGAIGAISAHLIHGLKNPLAGLEGFVNDAARTQEPTDGEAWASAVETTRRLRALVHEVTSVLRAEAGGGGDDPVPVSEWVESVEARLRPRAQAAGVEFVLGPVPSETVRARTANLAGLILDNLLANAVEAAPPGGRVSLTAAVRDQTVEFLVENSGPGMTEAMRASLFRPVRSTKRNGGGVGLAISHQLARHLGGTLELVGSGPAGTVFRLGVPRLRA